MTTPATVPTTIAQQRALIRAFRNSTQQWADTQQQEGQRYRDNVEEYARQLEQSNQAAQSQGYLMLQNHQQILATLTPVGLDSKLQEQSDTSFTPTIEDSTRLPATELSTRVSTLTKFTETIERSAKILATVREEEAVSRRLRVKRRNRNIAIFIVLILIYLFIVSYPIIQRQINLYVF